MIAVASGELCKQHVKVKVESVLEHLSYICGCHLSDIEATDDIENVLSLVDIRRRNLNCKTPIEIPYYNSRKR